MAIYENVNVMTVACSTCPLEREGSIHFTSYQISHHGTPCWLQTLPNVLFVYLPLSPLR